MLDKYFAAAPSALQKTKSYTLLSANKNKLWLALIIVLTVSGEEHIDIGLVESPVATRTDAVGL